MLRNMDGSMAKRVITDTSEGPVYTDLWELSDEQIRLLAVSGSKDATEELARRIAERMQADG